MALILKDKVTENILDVISLKGIPSERIPAIVREFEKDYIVIRKKEV